MEKEGSRSVKLDARICAVKSFIRELSSVQDTYCQNLARELKLNARGEDLLFDYLHNSEEEESFSEYVEKIGIIYQNLVSRKLTSPSTKSLSQECLS